MFRLFETKSKSIKKWRSRAWSIDPQKTRLTIITTKQTIKHVPPWIHNKNVTLNLISR
jgi:hypothetical protein